MKTLVCMMFAAACATEGAVQAETRDAQQQQRIDAEYRAAMQECAKVDGRKNRKACEVNAKGHRNVAQADLHADPRKGKWLESNRARMEAAGSNADAQYAAEKERCESLSGDAKNHCIADAKKKFSKG